MKQITKESINAFMNRQEFKKQNMKVSTLKNKWYLELHNNIIAVLHPDNTLMISNCGWKSNTTKERLNALPNVSIVQRDFIWYLNGEKWNGELTEIKQ
tara:strand:- start:102 stop:395 length:294 start_codon:yes stop_codon:yes gene_type:complete